MASLIWVVWILVVCDVFVASQQCNGEVVQFGTTGIVTDGPDPYNKNMNCSWKIQVPYGFVNLTFKAFETEKPWDKVVIYDGSTTCTEHQKDCEKLSPNANGIDGLSGKPALPFSLVSTGSSMYVVATSDDQTQYSGFYGEWNQIGKDYVYVSSPVRHCSYPFNIVLLVQRLTQTVLFLLLAIGVLVLRAVGMDR
jgi:hypothetical protein